MALAIDTSTPAYVLAGAGPLSTLTTASFTPPLGSLLVVVYSNAASAETNNKPTNTGGAVTWDSSVAIAETINQTAASVWRGLVTTSASMTVTDTVIGSSSPDWGIGVVVVTGQAATQNGATGVSTATNGTPSKGITTVGANSLVLGSVANFTSATVGTPGAGQSLTFNGHVFSASDATTGSSFWAQYLTGMNLAAGATATINDTAPTNIEYSLAMLEILADTGAAAASTSVFPVFLPRNTLARGVRNRGQMAAYLLRAPRPVAAVGPQNYQQPLTGSLTATGALTRGILVSRTAAIALAGGLVRVLPCFIAAALNLTGSLGRQVTRALVASFTPGGVVTRLTLVVFTASESLTGSLSKLTQRLLTGSLTSVGALGVARFLIRGFSATLGPSGALARTTAHLLTALIAAQGLVQRQVGHVLSGSLVPAGALRRLVNRILAGATAAWSGALSAVKSGGPQLYTQALAATLALSGLGTRQTARLVAAVVSGAGALARQVRRPLTAGLASSAALGRLSGRLLAGAVAASARLSRQTSKALTGALLAAGAITRAVAHALTGAMTPAAVLAKRIPRALTGTLTASAVVSYASVIVRSLSAALTSAGSLGRVPQKALTAVLAPSAAIARQTTRVLLAALTAAGTAAHSVRRALAASVAAAGTLSRTFGRVLSAALNFIGGLSTSGVFRVLSVVLSATLAAGGQLSRQTRRGLAAAVTFGARLLPSTGAVGLVLALTSRITRLFLRSQTATVTTTPAFVGEVSSIALEVDVVGDAYGVVIAPPTERVAVKSGATALVSDAVVVQVPAFANLTAVATAPDALTLYATDSTHLTHQTPQPRVRVVLPEPIARAAVATGADAVTVYANQ